MMNQYYIINQKWKYLRLSRLWVIALVLLVSVSTVLAQDITVTGRVTDVNGTGMPGVSITVKGTSRGTNTDVNGRYSISTPANGTLVFSFVGYRAEEVPVNNRSTVNVTLTEDTKALEEVVVVGYGTAKKRDVTGAVSAIGTKDFNKGIITSPEQLMQGRVAGVAITQNNGEPGVGINVRIRGTSSIRAGNGPLFVVDGVPLSGGTVTGDGVNGGLGSSSPRNPLNFLNPDDIASIDILKDASATAIYGARGAQGVVFITTKKGRQGKGTLDYSFSAGISNITKRFDLLSAEEYVTAGGQNNGAKTDWQNEVFRTAPTQQHNLSFGGGDANGNYRFSLGYMDQQGIIRNSGMKRYATSFNGQRKFINNRLTLGANINFANTIDTSVPVTDNSGFSGDLLAAVLKTNPTNPVRKPDGTLFQTTTVEPNPVAILEYTRDFTNTLRALGNLNAEYEILEGFKFKTVLGFDRSLSARKAAFSRDLVAADINTVGQAYFTDIETDNNLWENYFTYDKQFGNISLNGLLGYSYQSFDFYSKRSQATNFRTSDLDMMLNNVSSANNAQGRGSIIQGSNANFDELQSYFSRINVGFGNKYIVTATLRADGSTRFGPGNRYGYFPSFAAKWRLIEEDFISKDNFSDLGLRFGWGLTGNQEIPHNLYQQRTRYGGASIGSTGTQLNNGAFGTVAFFNPDLKWESTSQLNIGLDYGFFEGRLTGALEYYYKNTNNFLMQVISAQPAVQPFVWTNLDADVINRGVEVTVNGIVVDKKDFGWELNVNAAYNRNVVKNLVGVYNTGQINGQGLTGAFAQRIAAGQPLFAYFLREFGGFDTEGNSVYPNGDFQEFIGKSPIPVVTGGLTSNFRYKNFDLSLFFNGVFGNYIYSNNANAFFTKGSFANGRNVTRDVVNSGEGPLNAPDVSTRFLENGSFVRLQNLNLSYNVRTKSTVLSNLRLFVTGQNLLLFTKYSGQDPEVNTNKQINGVPSLGIDYTAYPRARTWTFGVNASF